MVGDDQIVIAQRGGAGEGSELEALDGRAESPGDLVERLDRRG